MRLRALPLSLSLSPPGGVSPFQNRALSLFAPDFFFLPSPCLPRRLSSWGDMILLHKYWLDFGAHTLLPPLSPLAVPPRGVSAVVARDAGDLRKLKRRVADPLKAV